MGNNINLEINFVFKTVEISILYADALLGKTLPKTPLSKLLHFFFV